MMLKLLQYTRQTHTAKQTNKQTNKTIQSNVGSLACSSPWECKQRVGHHLVIEQQCINSVKVEKFTFHIQKKKSSSWDKTATFQITDSNPWSYIPQKQHASQTTPVTLFCNLPTFQARYLVSEDSARTAREKYLSKRQVWIPKPVPEMINGSKWKKHWD